MDTTTRLPASSRVKACTECRQQKLRCDAAKGRSVPCSRCRRRGLKCEITTKFRRSKRRTKKEIQAELDSLREQVETQHPPDGTTILDSTALPVNTGNDLKTNEYSVGYDPIRRNEITSLPKAGNASNYADTTQSQAIADLQVSSDAIDACFLLFHQRYLPQLPIFEGRWSPNTCFAESEFLFWTIVATGAYKYREDPTLISLLAPHLITLAGRAMLSREKPLPTIQALSLLCTWPLPHDSMARDISPMLAGALLEHATNIGLHVYGMGQDFSRTRLTADRAQIQYRTRLWFLCITICQRVNLTAGVPPPLVPDSYARELSGPGANSLLPPSVEFEKQLTFVQTDGVVRLEQQCLATKPENRAAVLNPLVDRVGEQLQALAPQCPGQTSKFYLLSARLQVLCFHLFVPRESIEDVKLQEMYELAIAIIEVGQQLDSEQTLTECASIFTMKYLNLAAYTILRITRCHLLNSIDLSRGRRAYFFVIQFQHELSRQAGDLPSRANMILTQLWTSKKIFKKKDGSSDSLAMRCGSRLAMGVVHDCFWWWRCEFGGEMNPYEENQTPDMTTAGGPSAPLSEGTTPVVSASNSLEDIMWLDTTFPESQWPTDEDMLSLDWSQFQYDTTLPFSGIQGVPGNYVAGVWS